MGLFLNKLSEICDLINKPDIDLIIRKTFIKRPDVFDS